MKLNSIIIKLLFFGILLIWGISKTDLASSQTVSIWQIETVNSSNRCFSTNSVSLAIDSQGEPHLSYQNLDASTLNYSYKNQSNWITEVVQESSGAGLYSSIALDSSGFPHITYRDGGQNDLKYAYRNGANWTIDTVGNNEFGWQTSLILDNDDHPHISYLGNHEPSGNQTPKYAFWTGEQWDMSVIDDVFATGNTSIALDPLGNPHISYSFDQNLKYAVYINSTWITETVTTETDKLFAGQFNSISLDRAGMPRISYSVYRSLWPSAPASIPEALNYASKQSDGWLIEEIDSEGQVGLFNSLALDNQSQPHLIYFDLDNKIIKYATKQDTWVISQIAPSVEIEGNTSIKIDSQNQIHIAFCDERSQSIKYAKLIRVELTERSFLPIIKSSSFKTYFSH